MPDPVKPRVLVFDSGFGGLSVLSAMVRLYPCADYTYMADNACFPYGDKSEDDLVKRVVALVGGLIEATSPDLCLIACNTASTLVLQPLRQRFALPFVGTVPAIKPAAQQSESKLISILATPATVRRDYTHKLIADFAADCQVTLVGARYLAGMIEASLRGEIIDDQRFLDEIKPAFVVTEGGRTDVVVLACTHFPLARQRLVKLAPWAVNWLDPADAIARHAMSQLPPLKEGAGTLALLSSAPLEWVNLANILAGDSGLPPSINLSKASIYKVT